ncbi:hypothetical protein GOP47_0005141 [Adiantum capillus-veneris]|uniref:Uncharacterized protein n=1 Tax=Adiantum capillus-veneris TaxID=13818 RepID=A0A9D4V672_ADICA|nr:hypothetical protein GOP47_0005141 [Adiantum capillus-veneris]
MMRCFVPSANKDFDDDEANRCFVPSPNKDPDDHEAEQSNVENKREAQGDERAVKGTTKKSSAGPFKIPPSGLTTLTFGIQNPFITVIDDSVCIINKMEDKVCDGRSMDDSALKEAMSQMVGAAKLTSRSFKTPSSEIGRRPQHNALAQAFWLVTQPHEEPTYASIEEYQEAMSAKDMVVATSASVDNQCDLKITQKKVVDLIGNESNEWLDVRQEGDDGEAAERTRIRYDLNFVVYDRNILGPDKKVTTLIVDGTTVNLTLSKMFQVSNYACKYFLKNMEKGRFSPLYMELWGESNWRYGILYPSGVVLLEDGEISATSYSMGSWKICSEKKKRCLIFVKKVGAYSGCPIVFSKQDENHCWRYDSPMEGGRCERTGSLENAIVEWAHDSGQCLDICTAL